MYKYTVFNGEVLPDNFIREENIYYYRLYKSGDMCARDMLIKHNLRLVFTIIIENFSYINYDIDDLMSVGIEGLIKGIDSYDVDKNDNIANYVSKCIKYEVINFLRNNNRHKKKNISLISFDDPAKEINGESIPYKDILVIDYDNLEDSIIEKEMKEYYHNLIIDIFNSLSDRDKKIVMLYFGFVDNKFYKQREIAEIFSMNRANVSRIINSILEKIKQRMIYLQKCDDNGIINNYSKKKRI